MLKKIVMNRISGYKLQKCIAEETQLLAEEKWLIKTLSLIKKERNSLQIERLQLESLKMHEKGLIPKYTNSNVEEEPSTSVVNLMQSTKGLAGDKVLYKDPVESGPSETCNDEELNLAVTNSVFDKVNYDVIEEEDDDENMDVLIDMNMLMNGRM